MWKDQPLPCEEKQLFIFVLKYAKSIIFINGPDFVYLFHTCRLHFST